MMRQDHQQQVGFAQRQVLSQSVRNLLELVVLPPREFAELLGQKTAENPFLGHTPPASRGGAGQIDTSGAAPSLFAHVLTELRLVVRKPADLPIALRLVDALDERGFLVDRLSDIAADLSQPIARVEAVLAQLQTIEPVGLFARSVAECLALQLRAMGELDETAVRMLGNLEALAAKGAEAFARRHDLTPDRVQRLLTLLAKLRRTPALAFGETASDALPELYFERENAVWTVRALQPSAPQLSLRAPEYARALAGAGNAEDRANLRLLWREAQRLHQAAGLRDSTLQGLGQLIAQHQRLGLDSGLATLAPLTQRQMASQLGVHESTVSRIVRYRFASLEGRIVPLSRFFERPRPAGQSGMRTRSVTLQALRDLLASDQTAGLSDLALSHHLAAAGLQVSRRRLAKYRALLGIPSSRQRQAPPPA